MAQHGLLERIYRRVLQHLASRHWPPKSVLPPVRSLETEFSASRTTVLKALRCAANDGLLIIERRRGTTVLPAAPARATRLLADMAAAARVRRLAIGLPKGYFPLGEVPFYSRLVSALTHEADNANIEATAVVIAEADAVAFASQMVRQFDAAFLIGVGSEHLAALSELRRAGLPTVLYNRQIPGMALPSVREDDYGAAMRMGEVLAAKGHRDMCLFTPADYVSLLGGRSTLTGWMDFLSRSGLEATCTLPVFPFIRRTLAASLDHLLRVNSNMTALVLGNASFLSLVAENAFFGKLRIPADLSLVAMGTPVEFKWPSHLPRPTWFELDIDRAAQCAVELILRSLAGEEDIRSLRVPLKLHLTDSVGPAPQR